MKCKNVQNDTGKFYRFVAKPHFITDNNLFADTDGLITQALLSGNFEAAVDVCLNADRMV